MASTIRANTMTALKMTSHLSYRVKTRRYPFRRREPFYFIAPPIQKAIVLPGRTPVGLGWNHGLLSKTLCLSTCCIAFVCPVHQQRNGLFYWADMLHQYPPNGRIMMLAWRETKCHDRSRIRANQMQVGGPSASGLSNRLFATFLALRCHLDPP